MTVRRIDVLKSIRSSVVKQYKMSISTVKNNNFYEKLYSIIQRHIYMHFASIIVNEYFEFL